VVHEDAAHHASGHGEEMRAVVPRDVFRVDQPQVRLVDERGRLEAVTRALVTHVPPRELMELSVDERNQLLEGTLVALPPSEKAVTLVGFSGIPHFSPLFRPLTFSWLLSASRDRRENKHVEWLFRPRRRRRQSSGPCGDESRV
jgi:hypothetical protein